MTYFRTRPGSGSITRRLKNRIPDIAAFTAIIDNLQQKNPLGCSSYNLVKRTCPPVMPVRERYTAKFVYLDTRGKQVGTSSEVYDSPAGYETGIASMITNLSNIVSHRGRVVRQKDADLFSVTLKCYDPDQGFFFISLARDRLTVSSFNGTTIAAKVRAWADSIPELA
jgi:hypothetical protein